MAEPSEKNKEIEDFINSFTRGAFGRERTESIKGDVCAICGGPAVEFDDKLSEKEYTISSMCQACQNKFFD